MQHFPDDYDTLMTYYVYQGLFTNNFASSLLEKLSKLNFNRTQVFIQDFASLEKIRRKKVNTEIKSYEDDHLFILLGYDLEKDGSIPDVLQARLDLALHLLMKNPQSRIIVSGGIPENNRTEAYMMTKWLVGKGIDTKRIIEEEKSINTIENALFSLRAAHELASDKKVTLISSVSHLRRAKILFRIADRIINSAGTIFDSVGVPDAPELINRSNKEEQIAMYRDVLRIDGIWLYPNLVR